MKLVLVLVVVAWMSPMVIGAKRKIDTCNNKKVDACLAKLTFISGPDSHFPEKADEVNEHCKNTKVWEKCVRDYASKCLSSQARQTVQILIYSITRTNKNYCANNRRKNALSSVGVCANPRMKIFTSRMDKMNKAFHAIGTYPDVSLRVPMLCCNYFEFKDSTLEIIEEYCPENLNELENLLDGFGQDVLNLLCGDYTADSDKCQKILDQTPKWKKPLKHESFVMALSDVMQSLPDAR